jgi:hypothetical protein
MTLVTAHLSTAGRRARQVFSRRLQAVVLAVALVLGSAVPPSVAIAQEADQGREGIAAPEQPAPDSTADPDFDPGGETELPFEVGAPDSDDDSGDGAPVDVEPVDDPEAPPVPVDGPSAIAPDAIQGSDEAAPPVEATAPAEPVTPAAPPAPAPPPPAATTQPPPATDTPAPERKKRATARKPRRDRHHHRHATHVTVPPAVPAPAPPAAAPVETTATVQPVAEVASPASNDRVRPGQSSHTVQPGESLWTIASDLLGTGATDAQIAAETKRLYRLNRARIGDDPNMLITGTVLRLR